MENTINSGYDSDDDVEISTHRNSKVSRCSRIVDSSDEDLPKNENEKVSEEDATFNKVMVSNDNDNSSKVKGKVTSSEDESNTKIKNKIFKKRVFDDSDSESDGDIKEPIIKEGCSKSITNFEMIDKSNDAPDTEILKTRILDRSIYDAEDSSDEEDSSKLEVETIDKVTKKKIEEIKDKYKKTLMDNDIYDAEGSSDEGLIIASEPEVEDTAQKKKKGKKDKPKRNNLQRKSKQTAIEEIKSETQRLVRQSRISLPYHRPKQRSLSEFLSRRKSVPVVPLKTSTDELSKVWENIKEREKTAESFYKSDSDSSGNEKEAASTSEILDNANASTVDDSTNNNQDSLMNFRLHYTETETQNILEESGQAVLECSVNVNNSEANLEHMKIEDDEKNESLKPCGNKAVESESRNEFAKCMTIVDNSFDSQINTVDSYNRETILKENNTFNLLSTNDESSSEVVTKENLSLFDEGIIDGINPTEEKTEAITIDPVKNQDHNLLNKSNLIKLNMISDDKLCKVPRLSGQPDEMIDLDKSPDKRGAVKLISRFMKHITFKQKVKVQEDVVVAISEVNEKGEVVAIKEETVKIKRNEDSLKLKVGDSSKPGETRMKLKATLQHKIAQNREQQFAKRLEEFKLNEEEIYGVLEEKPDYEENEEVLTPSESGSDEEIEDDIVMDDKIKEKNPFADEEAEESENNEEELENDRGSESEEYSDAPSIYIGSLVDKDEDLPNLGLEMGLENSQRNNELMALCSGGFTQGLVDLNELEKNDALSQFHTNEILVPSLHSNEHKDEILGSTHEDSEEEITVKKKKKSKLTFSDDEDDIPTAPDELDDCEDEDQESNESEIEEVLGDDDEEVMAEEAVEGFREDEENVTKKAAKRFLEAEAELSGSEWGSADEDELDLDTMEKEEGDDDLINQGKVRSELEKIHMKELLDEDKREIRVLQELFLEDGDLHCDGPKRERQFRWYNQDGENENGSFMWNPDGVEKEGDVEDDEEDESWRKTRLERENFLRNHKGDDLAVENETVKCLKFAKSTVTKTSPMASSFATPDPKKQFSAIARRGSFLSRGEKLLSKLAELSNVNTSSDNRVGNVRGQRNMVFAVVSPPKEDSQEMSLKRKGANDIVMNASKKLKFSAHPSKTQGRLLEKLKMID